MLDTVSSNRKNTAGGALGGAVIGGVVGGPPGAIVGALLGGLGGFVFGPDRTSQPALAPVPDEPKE